MIRQETDILIVGTGAAGLYAALQFPEDMRILMIAKDALNRSDSFLAQGGICMLPDEEDYESYYEDTMRAGHYENDPESVEIMIRSSQEIIRNLIKVGVEFEQDAGKLVFTREGGHGRARILFHKDITGREITSKLLDKAQGSKNITLRDHTMMLDILCDDDGCYGIVASDPRGSLYEIRARYTILACGGLGGLYQHTTNFRHISGDALAIAIKHGIALEHMDYIQIHPTTLYSEKPGRRFLISESVRGEGAILLNKNKERFCNELQPRDVVTAEIHKQMEKDGMPYVWLSMESIPREEIRSHFPNILQQCLEEGYDPTRECIPVVPAQHYFMGGIKVNHQSGTSMNRLYAVGETSCNGVHGRNRLASNSLLESMVFAGRAAEEITERFGQVPLEEVLGKPETAPDAYQDLDALRAEYRQLVLQEIEMEKRTNDS